MRGVRIIFSGEAQAHIAVPVSRDRDRRVSVFFGSPFRILCFGTVRIDHSGSTAVLTVFEAIQDRNRFVPGAGLGGWRIAGIVRGVKIIFRQFEEDTVDGSTGRTGQKTGFLADRMSINLELPTADALRRLAPHKSRRTILTPMRQIQTRRNHNQEELALYRSAPQFVPAGQSTQIIIGASGESDYEIVSVAESLYRRFELKRVFYSAFVRVNEDSLLPALPGGPPLLREHRLYQADWLLRYYGFEAKELLSEKHPNFNVFLDPKCDWALSHMENFPVEINQAPYETLLRVPGIGVKSAQRIVKARRFSSLGFEDLKKIGVVLKRAVYFITCRGKTQYPLKLDEDFILRNLLHQQDQGLAQAGTYRQLSLFDDSSFSDSREVIAMLQS